MPITPANYDKGVTVRFGKYADSLNDRIYTIYTSKDDENLLIIVYRNNDGVLKTVSVSVD